MISVCLCTHLSLYLPYGWKQAALRHNRINLFLLSLCTIFVIIGKEAIDETICNHSSRGKRNSYGKRHSQTIHRNSRQTDISPYDRKFLPIRSEYRFNNRTSSKNIGNGYAQFTESQFPILLSRGEKHVFIRFLTDYLLSRTKGLSLSTTEYARSRLIA